MAPCHPESRDGLESTAPCTGDKRCATGLEQGSEQSQRPRHLPPLMSVARVDSANREEASRNFALSPLLLVLGPRHLSSGALWPASYWVSIQPSTPLGQHVFQHAACERDCTFLAAGEWVAQPVASSALQCGEWGHGQSCEMKHFKK